MSTIFQKIDPSQPAFTTEVQTGDWVRQFAFGALEPTAQVFHTPFMQLSNSYARPNTSNLANYNIGGVTAYFCDDIDFSDRKGALAEWTREARTLPANYNYYETYSYTFPGYYGSTVTRVPFTAAPTSRLQRDFFLIGNANYGASYTSPDLIPRFQPQNFAWAYRFDYTTIGNVLQNIGAQTFLDGYLANTNANLLLFASNPTLSTWQGWVANANTSTGTYEFEAEPSTVEWVAGPIWMRQRRFIRAQ